MEIRNNLLYGMGFLIIAISIAFYSFFYLPSIGQNQIELAKQQRAAESEAKAERAQQLKTCLSEADSNYSSSWKAECKADKNKEAGSAFCNLLSDRASVLEQYKSDERNLCFKLYD